MSILLNLLTAVLILGLGGSVLGFVGLLERPARAGSRWLRPGAMLAGLFALAAVGFAIAGQPLVVWLSAVVARARSGPPLYESLLRAGFQDRHTPL